MSDDIQSKLSQAFEHVEAGRLEDAINTLKPVLDASPDNADAWWIYLHAVSDPVEARHALDRVVSISPDYPGAAEMLDLLNAEFPLDTPAVSQAQPVPERPQIKPIAPPPPPVSVPEAPVGIPEQMPRVASGSTTRVPEPPVERRRSPLATLVVLAVVAVAIVLVFLLLNPNTGQPEGPTATVEPTAIVVAGATETSLPVQADSASPTAAIEAATSDQAATEETALTQETSEPVIESTAEPATPTEMAAEATEVDGAGSPELTIEAGALDPALAPFLTALEGYELTPAGVAVEELSTGPTIMANVCSAPGRQVRTLLPEVMQALASGTSSPPEGVEAIGVRLINCEASTVLVTVAATVEDAAQFAAGTSSAEQYSANWVALR